MDIDVEGLEHRIDALERWQSAQVALSSWKRWAVPIALTVVGLVFDGIGIIVLLGGK